MKAPLCNRIEPRPCEQESTRVMITEGENRGHGRRTPLVMFLCVDHFGTACAEVREAGEAYVWSELKWLDIGGDRADRSS